MDRDTQEIFQPEQVTPELQRYLSIVVSPRRRRELYVVQDPEPESTADEIWDRLGDYA